MKKYLLTILSLCLLPSFVYAIDTITIDLGGTPVIMSITAARKTALSKFRARTNRFRASQIPPQSALTAEEAVQLFLDNELTNVERDVTTSTTAGDADFCTIFKDNSKTTTAQRNQIIAIGAGASPCP